ncbi:MlaD family protein [Haliangium ochraceum]|uniref:Mammalian cell entry related domain protein n=1 Tax=Haliangium ochraceum (strain DSM 14365 / JCM 11303 / SMP-2) TaxID=502025 RepID=D0LTW4_HALO1|nr:MlaD family protein [Haliangium ochraceum]ACY15808.1 Mammalian cell entry related domain protein [Haliangium ochraceum DSM 14365]
MALGAIDDRRATRVGALVLLIIAALVLGVIGLQRCDVRERIRATVYFTHVGPLREGADVQVASRVIGEVEAISLAPAHPGRSSDHPLGSDDGVAVHVQVQARYAFMAPVNGSYFISAKGVVGERFIEIGAPPDNGPRERALAAGDEVRGVDAPHLDRALWQSYRSMIALEQAVAELSPHARALMRATEELSATLDQLEAGPKARALMGSLEQLGDSASAMFEPLNQHTPSWSALTGLYGNTQRTLTRTQALLARVRERAELVQTRLARIVGSVPEDLGSRLQDILSEIQDSLAQAESAMASATALMAQLERGQGTLGKILGDPTLFEQVKTLFRIIKNQPWRVVGPPPPP